MLPLKYSGDVEIAPSRGHLAGMLFSLYPLSWSSLLQD
jgi:hypothetical protein